VPLRRYVQSLAPIALSAIGLAFLFGCAKEPVRVDRNRPPRTFLVSAPPESSGSSYRVHLYWRGEDPDGYISGYVWAFDSDEINAYRFTTKTDSVFELTVNDSADIANGTQIPSLTRYHTFFVRAIDNLGKPDPNPAFFNRRIFNAGTIPPRVTFLPGPDVSGVLGGGDTLSDGKKFRICWTGNDSDGVVRFFKIDVGPYSTPLSSDTCAFFNDTVPGALGLVSGAYIMTTTAVDNAYAVGRERYNFVVNHDPETWFIPRGNPVGHYIRPYREGTRVNEVGTFAQNDTIPYQSTVWFDWDATDTTGGEANCISGWSLTLLGGTRLAGEPYTIGFLDTLATAPSVIRFKTSNPVTMGLVGFSNLILDSLDASYNLNMIVSSRDCSFRGDGTPATFRFNCDFPPRLDNLTERDTVANVDPVVGSEPCKVIAWASYDNEDGITKDAKITLDSQQSVLTSNWEQFLLVPYRILRQLAPGNPHRADVKVFDRAGVGSKETLTVSFNLP
jgi:hypothetical protein